MSSTIKEFKGDATLLINKLAALDANGIKNENNNLITKSEMILDDTDHTQTSRSVSYMSARSNAYIASFSSPTISLIPYSGIGGILEAPSEYLDGALVYFKSPINSDGITNIFLNINGLGDIPLIEKNLSTVRQETLIAGIWNRVIYDKSKNVFIALPSENISFSKVYITPSLALAPNTATKLFFDASALSSGGFLLTDGEIIVPLDGVYEIYYNFITNAPTSVGSGTFFNTTSLEAELLANDIVIKRQFSTVQLEAVLTLNPPILPISCSIAPVLSILHTGVFNRNDRLAIRLHTRAYTFNLNLEGGEVNNSFNIKLIEEH